MGLILLPAFISIPVLEIAVFITVGGRIGLWPTLAIIVLTAMIGAALVRHQGIAVIGRVQQSLDAGRFPVAEVFDGLCLLVAGALLLTPGFVTDAFGFLLLVPRVRAALRAWLGRYLLASGRVTVWSDAPLAGDEDVLDADYEEIFEEEDQTPAPRKRIDHRRR